MYVAVKGGEQAIENAHGWLAEARRGNPEIPELEAEQVAEQLGLAVARVMAEGSLYDTGLAALAIKQARGDLIEAAFLIRAFRTTLPRFGHAEPLDTTSMLVARRISATYKDLPGGQVLGPTFDYTHRLIDFALAAGMPVPDAPRREADDETSVPHVLGLVDQEGLIEPADGLEAPEPADPDRIADLTREPLSFPAARDLRLQNLARGDEGYLLAMAYSTQRGFGSTHPFVGELRVGTVRVSLSPEELGFEIEIADITVTECEMVNQFRGSGEVEPVFTRGYGLAFGHSERKAMSMALLDRAMRATELGEEVTAPAQDQEFVMMHSDSVQASGFVEHLKLPHYVDFQSELELIRRLRTETRARRDAAAEETGTEAASDAAE